MAELCLCLRKTAGLALLAWLFGCGEVRNLEDQESPAPIPLERAVRHAGDHRLKPGAADLYEIRLEIGEYAVLLVEQKGVDLVLSFRDPAGRGLLEMDNWSGADGSRGAESVHVVAETDGIYQLEIRATSRNKSGPYNLRLEELRPALASDRQRALAERLLATGDRFYWRGGTESRRQAVEVYERALHLFRGVAASHREADALFRLAEVHAALHKATQAETFYGEALALYEALGNRRQRALTLHNRGFLRLEALDIEAAREDFELARALWRDVEDLRGLAMTQNELGVIFRIMSDGTSALLAYDQALELWRQLGDRDREAQTLHNRGRLYMLLGRDRQALDDLSRSLTLRRQLGRPRRIAVSLNTLGLFRARRHEVETALGHFREALALASGPQDRIVTLAGLGRARLALGKTEESLTVLEQALELAKKEGERAWQAQILDSLGRAWSAAGQKEKASSSLEQAFKLFSEIRDRSGQAQTRLALAELAREKGNLQKARERAEEALAEVEDLRSRVAQSPDLRAYFFAHQQSYYDFYVDLLMELDRGEPGAGYAALALAASERGRARSLLEGLSRDADDPRARTDSGWVEREGELERQIHAREYQILRLAGGAAPERERIAELEAEQRDLLRRYERLREEALAASSGKAVLHRYSPLEAPAIQRLFGDGETLLLKYKLGEERSFLWAVTEEAISGFALPRKSEIEADVRRTYDLLVANQRASRQRTAILLDRLSDILLRPAARYLGSKKRLVIVGDGVLHYLPFAALPLPGGDSSLGERPPLVHCHEIVYLPSASTLAALRRPTAEPGSAKKTLAVLADPIFHGEDPRLETSPERDAVERTPYRRLVHSGVEAGAILELVSPDERFAALGFDARRQVLTGGAIADYRLLHLATHAEIDSEHPELSRLVLSLVDPRGRPRADGLLYAYEIRRLDLRAELVVLSACRTALGEEIRGEGLVGWKHGFFEAGARRLVVSLWNVDDSSTAVLMEQFYRELLVTGSPPSEALRLAQDAVRREKRWRAPLYWAGFVFEGDWQDISRSFARAAKPLSTTVSLPFAKRRAVRP